jgi:hypothetical protein
MKFSPKKETLPQPQQDLWPELSKTPKLGFVLYGGTAIALQLGHRISVDFDFFSSEPLDIRALYQELHFLKDSRVIQEESNALSLLVPGPQTDDQKVKVSFFGNLKMGRVDTPLITDDGVMQVASLNDLMATKLKVILQRAEYKDYFDIAAMIKAGVSLENGLGAARSMFGNAMQPSESLKALTYFNDGDLHKLSLEDKNCLSKAAQAVSSVPTISLRSGRLINTPPLIARKKDLGLER